MARAYKYLSKTLDFVHFLQSLQEMLLFLYVSGIIGNLS